MTGPDDPLGTLRRRLEHVLEPRMRLALVREWLLSVEAASGGEALVEILDRGVPPGDVHDPLRAAVLELLSLTEPAAQPGGPEPLPYAVRAALYSQASRLGSETLQRLLRTGPALESIDHPERRLPRELADIPLGRRRALAKGEDKLLLDGLARDPDRVVIDNLLRNPRLREEDVVRIAALRPVAASTLEAVAGAARWSQQPRVRVALARNPYCPVDTVLRMLGALPLPELREMSRDPDLHPETLAQVRAELARRGG